MVAGVVGRSVFAGPLFLPTGTRKVRWNAADDMRKGPIQPCFTLGEAAAAFRWGRVRAEHGEMPKNKSQTTCAGVFCCFLPPLA
jgi:hypothetical protein